jgi:anti-sigma factor RsiW
VSGLLNRLLGPGEPELSCEACFDELDRYVDLELAGADADREIPGMRAHLAGCPACAEEATTLLLLAAEDTGLDPAPALRRLRSG